MIMVTGMQLRLAVVSVLLASFLVTPAIAQQRFQVFFLAVGNSQYIQPGTTGLHGFGGLSGANSSARTVADVLSRNGAVAGITLTSAGGRYVSKADFDSALAAVTTRMRGAGAAKPLLLVYFVGHGISEGIAWNHFSVPGNFVFGAPLDRLNIEELASHTIHAASVADELDKLKVPYVLLLDTCYEGQPAPSPRPFFRSRRSATCNPSRGYCAILTSSTRPTQLSSRRSRAARYRSHQTRGPRRRHRSARLAAGSSCYPPR